MSDSFDHEKLRVYQDAVHFVTWTYIFFEEHDVPTAIKNQLERSAISIPLNIAEGNGKTSPRDRARYFEIARGSALESAASLDILHSTGKVSERQCAIGKQHLIQIVSMLVGLIKATTDNRLAEISEEGYLNT